MSVHAIHKICREVLRDHNFRARMQSDPAAAIAGYDLTAEERRALLAGDVVTPGRQRFYDGLSRAVRVVRPQRRDLQ
jgi:hypothetical protein